MLKTTHFSATFLLVICLFLGLSPFSAIASVKEAVDFGISPAQRSNNVSKCVLGTWKSESEH